MEPVDPKIKYVIMSEVAHVGQENPGWWVRFQGSQERMYFGSEEPTLKPGDRVKITIEKVEHGQTQ